ncbi:MAG: hypothetical protein IT341_08235 [Chloroflexi bacterium]|nr:hypothetical protein [Chloroflexota bacterium]
MAHDTKPIRVLPDSDLARLLDAAARAPVLLEKEGVLYRVSRVEADSAIAAYDPAAVRASIQAAAGLLTPADAERLKAGIYQAREEGTRPE